MRTRGVLEIACNSAASAFAAAAGGADRLELCSDLAAGGTTPPAGMLAVVRRRVQVPIHVLVRPRAGDFVYDAEALEVMLAEIAQCRRIGCEGIVTGALDADGSVDAEACAALVAAAGPLPVTFHRAFDQVNDRAAALERIIALGFRRVLSSGGQPTALQGAAVLAVDVARARGRVAMMAGAGITAATIAEVARRSGCHELHASASVWRPQRAAANVAMLPGLDPGHRETDAARVAALRAALDSR